MQGFAVSRRLVFVYYLMPNLKTSETQGFEKVINRVCAIDLTALKLSLHIAYKKMQILWAYIFKSDKPLVKEMSRKQSFTPKDLALFSV